MAYTDLEGQEHRDEVVELVEKLDALFNKRSGAACVTAIGIALAEILKGAPDKQTSQDALTLFMETFRQVVRTPVDKKEDAH